MGLQLIWNNILREEADAIVTPASRNPRVGTGLDRVIHGAAGPKLLAARKEHGRIAPGKVAVTPSFDLNAKTGAKWVIHALGPVWDPGNSGDREKLILDGCYLRILCKAVELKCKSISIPVMSSGKFGMPMRDAVDVAVRAIEDFLAAFPDINVKLMGIDGDFVSYARGRYGYMFVSRFTEEKVAKYREYVGGREDDPTSFEDAFLIGEEDDVFNEQLFDHIVGDGSFKGMFQRLWEHTRRREKAAREAKLKKRRKIGRYEFVYKRNQLAKVTGISSSTIKHFCSSSDESSRTTKRNMIMLSVAMRLPLRYAKRFLATCNYKLGNSDSDKFVADFLARRAGGMDRFLVELEMHGIVIADKDKAKKKDSK